MVIVLLCLAACVHFLHSGGDAVLAFWPAGKFCPLAGVREIHPGLDAISAFWPACKVRLQASRKIPHPGCLHANSAFLKRAKFARLLSAKIARDS